MRGVGTNHRREESIYLEWKPITRGKRVYTWSGNHSQEGRKNTPGVELIAGGKRVYTWGGNQSQEGREHIPGVGTNHRREESIYLEWEPIIGGKRVYTWSCKPITGGQRVYNWREESVYLEWEPIAGGKRVYTLSGSQSQEGGEYVPGVGTNHRREESIYLEWEPITGGRRVYTWGGSLGRCVCALAIFCTGRTRQNDVILCGVGTNHRREETIYLG